MTAWKIPLLIAAIAVPIVGGFALGSAIGESGSGLGLAAGAMVAAAIVVIAARQIPRGPIGSAPAGDGRRHLLLVATHAVEEPAEVAEIARVARLGRAAPGSLGEGSRQVDVLVLAPARIGFLDRWASDVEPAREAAQKNLVATVAALAKAGIAAEARVGDEDVVQAVEDHLQTFPATEVVLVSGGGGVTGGDADEGASEELERRLEPEFHHIVLGA